MKFKCALTQQSHHHNSGKNEGVMDPARKKLHTPTPTLSGVKCAQTAAQSHNDDCCGRIQFDAELEISLLGKIEK